MKSLGYWNQFFQRGGLVTVLLLGVSALMIIFFLMPQAGTSSLTDGNLLGADAYGKMYGKQITNKDIQPQLNSIAIEQFLTQNQRIDIAQLSGNEFAYPYVINRLRILRLAEEQGFADVSEAELKEELMNLPFFQTAGKFDKDKYLSFKKNFIEESILTMDDFENTIADNIVIERFYRMLNAYQVSDKQIELEQKLSAINTEFIVKAFTETEITEKKLPTEEEIKTVYEEQKTLKYAIPESRTVLVASLKVESPQVTDEEIETYYASNKKQYGEQVQASHILIKASTPEEKQEARKKMAEILIDAKAGKDFAELAKSHSEDGSAARGGDLGYFGRGAMVPEFEKAAFGLKDGEVSGLVESQFGIHIIKRKAYRSNQPLSEVKNQIKSTLERQKSSSNATTYKNRIMTVAEDVFIKTEGLSPEERKNVFRDKAQKANLKLVTTYPFKKGDTEIKPLSADYAPAKIVEQAQNLTLDQPLSGVIEGNDHYSFICLVGISEAKIQELDDVKEQIIEDIQFDDAVNKIREKAQAFLTEVQASKEAPDAFVSSELGKQFKVFNVADFATDAATVQADAGKLKVGEAAVINTENGAAVVYIQKVTYDDVPSMAGFAQYMKQIEQRSIFTSVGPLLSEKYPFEVYERYQDLFSKVQ